MGFRDNQIYIDTVGGFQHDPEFIEYIEEQRKSLEISTEQRE